MNVQTKLFEAIQESVATGKAQTIDLSESSTLTGSGNDAGGRTLFDDAFAAARNENPFRAVARQIKAPNSSSVAFSVKQGNATLIGTGTASTNPWVYAFTQDNGSPNIAAGFWQMPTRAITAQFPVRTAVLDDINYITEVLISDLAAEFAQQEALSIARNNDQAGTTTHGTGGVNGLRGLDSYTGNATTPAWGSNGYGVTSGLHTILNFSISASAFDYDKARQTMALLPPQYWRHPSTAWMMTPARWSEYVNNSTHMAEVGSRDGYTGNGLSCLGVPVIINPYLSAANSIYLACWDKFLTIADVQDMTVQMYDQTQAGFMTLFAMKRMVSTVRDIYAGVRVST